VKITQGRWQQGLGRGLSGSVGHRHSRTYFRVIGAISLPLLRGSGPCTLLPKSLQQRKQSVRCASRQQPINSEPPPWKTPDSFRSEFAFLLKLIFLCYSFHGAVYRVSQKRHFRRACKLRAPGKFDSKEIGWTDCMGSSFRSDLNIFVVFLYFYFVLKIQSSCKQDKWSCKGSAKIHFLSTRKRKKK